MFPSTISDRSRYAAANLSPYSTWGASVNPAASLQQPLGLASDPYSYGLGNINPLASQGFLGQGLSGWSGYNQQLYPFASGYDSLSSVGGQSGIYGSHIRGLSGINPWASELDPLSRVYGGLASMNPIASGCGVNPIASGCGVNPIASGCGSLGVNPISSSYGVHSGLSNIGGLSGYGAYPGALGATGALGTSGFPGTFNPMVSGGLGHFQSFPGGLPAIQKLVQNLVADRARDYRNLELVNDLQDIKEDTRQADHILRSLLAGQPVPPQVLVAALIKDRQVDRYVYDATRSIINDAKYNRHADNVIGALVAGRPYAPCGDELARLNKNVSVDSFLHEKARNAVQVAVSGQPWYNPLTPNRVTKGLQSTFELCSASPLFQAQPQRFF